jgi:hypothetical protein
MSVIWAILRTCFRFVKIELGVADAAVENMPNGDAQEIRPRALSTLLRFIRWA